MFILQVFSVFFPFFQPVQKNQFLQKLLLQKHYVGTNNLCFFSSQPIAAFNC